MPKQFSPSNRALQDRFVHNDWPIASQEQMSLRLLGDVCRGWTTEPGCL